MWETRIPQPQANILTHRVTVLSITVLEQVKKSDLVIYRKEREEHHIRRFNTLYKGLNRKV